MRGIQNAQEFGYPAGEFAVIVSEYVPQSQLDQRHMLEHARVITDCFKMTTVLPFRFGTLFENDESLRRSVRANRKTFTESVSHLRGIAEMHLNVIVKDGAIREAMKELELPNTVGSEYLSKLKEQASRQRERQTRARALSMQVNKFFHPLEEEITCRRDANGHMLIDIAHLIDHKSIEKYQNRYNLASKQFKDVQLLMTGPYPPFRFTAHKWKSA
jgi:hypothetical protein